MTIWTDTGTVVEREVNADRDEAGASRGREMQLLVDGIDNAADGVVLVRFVGPAGASLPPWEPGAHLEVVLPSSLIRHYSLCGDPRERGSYTVAVLRVADGRGGSLEIHDGTLVGASLTIRGPRNHFRLVNAPSYLLLAGGIGVTPLSAMARHLAQVGADWQLVYGGRSRSVMAFADEMYALDSQRVRIVTEDDEGYPDFAAIVADLPAGTAIYCCGPEAMISHVEQVWSATGGDTTLQIERFLPSGNVNDIDTSLDRPFEIELARRGIVLTVGADRSALDVVREVVPTHPWSCHEGECGSCEVTVLAGVVDHRDEVLSDEEREANDSMMLCVSRALCDRLVIDL